MSCERLPQIWDNEIVEYLKIGFKGILSIFNFSSPKISAISNIALPYIPYSLRGVGPKGPEGNWGEVS